MDPMVRALVWARAAARVALPASAIGALGTLVVVDATQPLSTPVAVGAVVVGAALLATRVISRVRASGAPPLRSDLELAGLAAVGVSAAIERADAQLGVALQPLAYALVALVAGVARPAATWLVAFALVVVEGAECLASPGQRGLADVGAHAAFVALFAILHRVVLHAEVASVRQRSSARLGEEMARLREQARSYRLLDAPAVATSETPRPGDVERLARSSVEEIHEAVVFALELLRRSLELHGAMLFWRNESGTHVRLLEAQVDSDAALVAGPLLAGDGVIGAVISRRATVTLENLKATYKLPYYEGSCPVRHLTAVPIEDHGQVRGVLVVDRTRGLPFEASDEDMVAGAARFLARAVLNERVFVQVERAKAEQGKLYRASEALGAAVGEADVVDAAVRAALEIAQFDFAAVTLWDEKSRSHEIRAVSGLDGEDLLGARFAHNGGLVSMVVQNRHPLPWRGEWDADTQVLFAKRLEPPKMPSMLVLPLVVHERPLGTLVLGARRRHAFGAEERPLLEILASHVAVSLSNARMMKKLEDLATTDGMTGLLNKRAMLDLAHQKIAAAARFERKLAIVVTDIDHFKKVNDGYGHDVGDQVIKGLGELLRRAKRQTDSVARFGGEEFVIVCEETDDRGAMLLAERIRTELEQTVFPTPQGELRVTCSLGIATFPEAGRDWESLFKAADEALYVSKRSGRNRSTVWHPSRRTAA